MKARVAVTAAATLGVVAIIGAAFTLTVKNNGRVIGHPTSINFTSGMSCQGSGSEVNCAAAVGPTLPLSGPNGGLGAAQAVCTSDQKLTCDGTSCACDDHIGTANWANSASWLAGTPTLCSTGNAPTGVDRQGNALNCSAIPPAYWLPVATFGMLGGVTGPAVSAPGLLTSMCPGTTKVNGLDGNGKLLCDTDFTSSGGAPTSKYLLQIADASLPNAQAMGALGTGLVANTTTTGVQSIYGGTDCGAGKGVQSLDSSGAALVCNTIPSPYTLPAATAAALGGVKGPGGALLCAGTTKVIGVNAAGMLQCDTDVDTIYTLPAASAVALGGVKGPAGALVCTGTNKVTGIDASGILQCGVDLNGPTDISGAHYVTVQSEANLSAETVMPICSGTDKLTYNGSTISCATDQVGAGVVLPLSGPNGGIGQAQPNCSPGTGYYLTCSGTICTCDSPFDINGYITAAHGGLGQPQDTCTANERYMCSSGLCYCQALTPSVNAGKVVYTDGTSLNVTAATTRADFALHGGTTPGWQNSPNIVWATYTNTTSTTAGPVTGLTWAIAAGATQSFTCNLATVNTSTSIIRLAIATPASPSSVSAQMTGVANGSANILPATIGGPWASTCTNCTNAGTSGITAATLLHILSGAIVNGVNAGNVTIYFAASTSGQTNAVTAASSCTYWTK